MEKLKITLDLWLQFQYIYRDFCEITIGYYDIKFQIPNGKKLN